MASKIEALREKVGPVSSVAAKNLRTGERLAFNRPHFCAAAGIHKLTVRTEDIENARSTKFISRVAKSLVDCSV